VAALQRRERRLLVLGAVVAAGVLGYMYVIEPLRDRHDQVQTLIAGREDLLARQQRLVARRGLYAQEREGLKEEIAQRRGRLLPGDKPPLAASELQKLVKTTAQDTGVEVRSERVLPVVEWGAYVEVPVEVTLSGPIRSMVQFLQRVEAVPAQVSIQDVKLRVVSVAAPRELLATVALTGYIASSGDLEQRGRGESKRPPGA
jgi:Tfp pilus assembly protein PilO